LDERGEVGALKKEVGLIYSHLKGETRGAIAFIIRGIGVVVKLKVRRNLGGGLGLKSQMWELVVRGMQILGWFKEV